MELETVHTTDPRAAHRAQKAAGRRRAVEQRLSLCYQEREAIEANLTTLREQRAEIVRQRDAVPHTDRERIAQLDVRIQEHSKEIHAGQARIEALGRDVATLRADPALGAGEG